MASSPVSSRFRFRFVVRGEHSTRAALCAISSLLRCHPHAQVVVVDANDEETLDPAQLPDGCALRHVRPPDDEIARHLGRGSRKHLFYWRHSPDVLVAIGDGAASYDVHADTDMLFLRPMNLAALVPHLENGRIAAAVDRSTIDYYRLMEELADGDGDSFPVAGSRGPMVQGGLIFRNRSDDGGVFDRMWELACAEARAGALGDVPWDDMAFLTNLLGHDGPLWGRLIALGHEWNFISDEERDPGVFGHVAHYGGGEHLKAFMVKRFATLFPPVDGLSDLPLWQREPDVARVGYGRVGLAGEAGFDALHVSVDGGKTTEALSLHPPFSVTWRVPGHARAMSFKPALSDTSRRGARDHAGLRLLAYVDGRLAADTRVGARPHAEVALPVEDAESVTLIGVTRDVDYCHFVLETPRWE